MTAPSKPADGGGIERITHVAICLWNTVWRAECPPNSHWSLSRKMQAQLGCGVQPLNGTQGFVTSAGRFVGRAEAKRIAMAAGQIVSPISGSDDLFSEELRPPTAMAPASDHHHYISTACYHGLHARCRQECKFCGAKCACPCGHVVDNKPADGGETDPRADPRRKASGVMRASCCQSIVDAHGARAKAHAALDANIGTGGYDHWGEVEEFAKQAASEVRNATTLTAAAPASEERNDEHSWVHDYCDHDADPADTAACEIDSAIAELEQVADGVLVGDSPLVDVGIWVDRLRRSWTVLATPAPVAEPWDVTSCLSKLAYAAHHLLHDHDCDVHGHEEISAAMKAARRHIARHNGPAPAAEGASGEDVSEYADAQDFAISQRVRAGDGPVPISGGVFLGTTDNGDIGVFANDEEDATAICVGDTAYEAISIAILATAYAAAEGERNGWPGEWCKRCSRRNNVGFSVPDDVWSAVVRGRWNVLCPACFDEEAQAAKVPYTLTATGVVSWSDWSGDNPGEGERTEGLDYKAVVSRIRKVAESCKPRHDAPMSVVMAEAIIEILSISRAAEQGEG